MKKKLFFCFKLNGSNYSVDFMFIKNTENEILPVGTYYWTSSSASPRFKGKVYGHSYSEDTNTFETEIISETKIEKKDVPILKEVMEIAGWSISIDSSK